MKLYWVDTKIHGVFEEAQEEMYGETTAGQAAETDHIRIGGFTRDEPMALGDDDDETHQDDSDDDADSDAPKPAPKRTKIDKVEEERALEARFGHSCYRLELSQA